MNLDLHKELYFFEWSRKEQLAGAANLPVGLITVLAGGVLFLGRTFPYQKNFPTLCFTVFGFLCVIFLLRGIWHLIKSLHGYWYEQIPDSNKLQDYFKKLREYHQAKDGSKEALQEDFDLYLQNRLAEATAINRKNNTKTAGALHDATGSIVYALVFAGLSLIPYFSESFARESANATIQADTPIEIRPEDFPMPNSQEPTERPQGEPPKDQPQPRPQNEPSSPPKPEGPPNEQVRKDGETRQKR